MIFIDKKEKGIQSKDEIGDILNAPLNFYISWGTFFVTFVMIIIIVVCSYLPCTQTVKGEGYFSLVNEDFIECLISIEKQNFTLIHIGQEIIIEDQVNNEKFIGKIDSIALQSYKKYSLIKAKIPLEQNNNIEEYIMNGNNWERDVKIIVDKFFLGDKILDSFRNLFAEYNNKQD